MFDKLLNVFCYGIAMPEQLALAAGLKPTPAILDAAAPPVAEMDEKQAHARIRGASGTGIGV